MDKGHRLSVMRVNRTSLPRVIDCGMPHPKQQSDDNENALNDPRMHHPQMFLVLLALRAFTSTNFQAPGATGMPFQY